eukprot:m.879168 g.879168  ORF g.879168 m.879168 type:complete len:1515 (-) comp59842_c0_seq1:179-4723(-)
MWFAPRSCPKEEGAPAEVDSTEGRTSWRGGDGRHNNPNTASLPGQSDARRRSRRMRLVVVAVLVVAAAAADPCAVFSSPFTSSPASASLATVTNAANTSVSSFRRNTQYNITITAPAQDLQSVAVRNVDGRLLSSTNQNVSCVSSTDATFTVQWVSPAVFTTAVFSIAVTDTNSTAVISNLTLLAACQCESSEVQVPGDSPCGFVCRPCASGNFQDTADSNICKSCAACPGGQYVSTPCGATTDTVCSNCTTTCPKWTTTTTRCSLSADTVCTPLPEKVTMDAVRSAFHLGSTWTGDCPCQWKNVTCFNATECSSAITAIDLSGWSLKGGLPSFANMIFLTTLDLSGNELNGSLPAFSPAAKLEVLDLSDNHFTGPLATFASAIAGLPKLKKLDLSDNKFTGSLPSLKGLSLLVELSVARNKLDGTLSVFSKGLPAPLKSFDAHSNNFTGALPAMTQLSLLDVSKNQFSGRIPDWRRSSIAELFIQENDLIGNLDFLPPNATMTAINVSQNRFYGALPGHFDGESSDTFLQRKNYVFDCATTALFPGVACAPCGVPPEIDNIEEPILGPTDPPVPPAPTTVGGTVTYDCNPGFLTPNKAYSRFVLTCTTNSTDHYYKCSVDAENCVCLSLPLVTVRATFKFVPLNDLASADTDAIFRDLVDYLSDVAYALEFSNFTLVSVNPTTASSQAVMIFTVSVIQGPSVQVLRRLADGSAIHTVLKTLGIIDDASVVQASASTNSGAESSSSNVGVAVGAAIGGIVGIILIVLLVLVLIRRSRAPRKRDPKSVRSKSDSSSTQDSAKLKKKGSDRSVSGSNSTDATYANLGPGQEAGMLFATSKVSKTNFLSGKPSGPTTAWAESADTDDLDVDDDVASAPLSLVTNKSVAVSGDDSNTDGSALVTLDATAADSSDADDGFRSESNYENKDAILGFTERKPEDPYSYQNGSKSVKTIEQDQEAVYESTDDAMFPEEPSSASFSTRKQMFESALTEPKEKDMSKSVTMFHRPSTSSTNSTLPPSSPPAQPALPPSPPSPPTPPPAVSAPPTSPPALPPTGPPPAPTSRPMPAATLRRPGDYVNAEIIAAVVGAEAEQKSNDQRSKHSYINAEIIAAQQAGMLKSDEQAPPSPAPAKPLEPIVPTEQWSSIECIMWLKHAGFKDFVDTFYSNGFEGAQLVLLSVESFGGMRAHPAARCAELIAAIDQLKDNGGWDPLNPDAPPRNPLAASKASSIQTTSKSTTVKCDVCRAKLAALSCPEGCAGRLFCTDCFSFIHQTMGLIERQSHNAQYLGVDPTLDPPFMEKLRTEHTLSLTLTREDSVAVLQGQGPGDEGEYLLRRSQKNANVIVLSLVHSGKVHHFQLERRDFDGHFVTSTGLKFPSLELMIDQFKNAEDVGLPCRLTHATRAYDHILKANNPTAESSFGFDEDREPSPEPRERINSYNSDASSGSKLTAQTSLSGPGLPPFRKPLASMAHPPISSSAAKRSAFDNELLPQRQNSQESAQSSGSVLESARRFSNARS